MIINTLIWSTQKPSVPGWYFVKEIGFDMDVLELIEDSPGEYCFWCNHSQMQGVTEFRDCFSGTRVAIEAFYEFAGPIPLPKDKEV